MYNYAFSQSKFSDFIICIVFYFIAYTFLRIQEFLAHGFTNLAGSFFSCFVASGSLSRSLIQDVTGGNTQVIIHIAKDQIVQYIHKINVHLQLCTVAFEMHK